MPDISWPEPAQQMALDESSPHRFTDVKDLAASNIARLAEKKRPEWGTATEDRTIIRNTVIVNKPVYPSNTLCSRYGLGSPCTCLNCFVSCPVSHSRLKLWRHCKDEINIYCRNMALLNVFYTFNEQEVKFINKVPTKDSFTALAEIELDFLRMNIPHCFKRILNKYSSLLTCPNCKKLLKDVCKVWFSQALRFFNELMTVIYNCTRCDIIIECKKKCASKAKVYDLIGNNPMKKKELALLKNGLNFIPHSKHPEQYVVNELNTCIKNCIVGIYKGLTGDNVKTSDSRYVNPSNYDINEIIALVNLQPKFNTRIDNCITEILYEFMRHKVKHLNMLRRNDAIDDDAHLKLTVKGGFIAIADKGIAIVLLPYAWYNLQFANLIKNPSYSLLNMRQTDCITMLLNKIENFELNLTVPEKEILKEYFKKGSSDYRIAAIKLLPKIHKLSCEPCLANLFDIPSRIVRGGEACPLNAHSKSLQALLTETMNDLRNNFRIICKSDFKFPLITGCEQYFEHINGVPCDGESFFETLLVTSDFKDAFTNATLAQLINAIHQAGKWLKYNPAKIKLMIKLARLVIPLCTFNIPQGIIISRDGYPIGGHASCECLNLNLLICEFRILLSLTESDTCLKSLVRLVDDVSMIFKGPFKNIARTLNKIVSQYPPMELNIQFSPRLSNFLDYRIFNTFYNANKLTTVMSRKVLNTYQYVKPSSNCPPAHKGCVVDSTLHRIFRRCNVKTDRIIQINYTKLLMRAKNYPDSVFETKFKKFLSKRLANINGTSNTTTATDKTMDHAKRIRASIPFDDVLKTHEFFKKFANPIAKKYGLNPPVIVPKPKLVNLITTKKNIISTMSAEMGYNNNLSMNSFTCPSICKLCAES